MIIFDSFESSRQSVVVLFNLGGPFVLTPDFFATQTCDKYRDTTTLVTGINAHLKPVRMYRSLSLLPIFSLTN